MIVKELIEKLQQFPHDMVVVVDGYEGGFSNPGINDKPIALVCDPVPYEGEYRVANRHETFGVFEAVYLYR